VIAVDRCGYCPEFLTEDSFHRLFQGLEHGDSGPRGAGRSRDFGTDEAGSHHHQVLIGTEVRAQSFAIVEVAEIENSFPFDFGKSPGASTGGDQDGIALDTRSVVQDHFPGSAVDLLSFDAQAQLDFVLVVPGGIDRPNVGERRRTLEILLRERWPLIWGMRLLADDHDLAPESFPAQSSGGRGRGLTGADENHPVHDLFLFTSSHFSDLGAAPHRPPLFWHRGLSSDAGLGVNVHLSAFHLHWKCGLTFAPLVDPASGEVESPLVAWTNDLALEDKALREISLLVNADVPEGVDVAVVKEQGDAGSAGVDEELLAALQLLEVRHLHPVGHAVSRFSGTSGLSRAFGLQTDPMPARSSSSTLGMSPFT
jgi:hypothetical protein